MRADKIINMGPKNESGGGEVGKGRGGGGRGGQPTQTE